MNLPATPSLTTETLNRALTDGWPHGRIKSLVTTRIGEDFGFGGHVYRLDVETDNGPHALVAKRETRQQVERVIEVYHHIGDVLTGRIPTLYGWNDDITLFEMVSPATQGDGLDVRPWQVAPMTRVLADLHASTWSPDRPGWAPEHWTRDRWQVRVDLARERYPDRMDKRLYRRLVDLQEEFPEAIATLRKGPTALIHFDVGYDNTLWRPDGAIVLLDWSNARFGPPGLDLAAHLFESESEEITPGYLATMNANGISIDRGGLVAYMLQAVRVFLRGVVGFTGYPAEPHSARLLCFRDIALDRVRTGLDWLERNETSLG